MSVCICLVVSIKLSLQKSRRPGKQFVGPGIQAVVSDRQRDHAVPVLRVIHECECPCESYESGAWCVCAVTHEIQSLPCKEEEGDLAVCTYILYESYIGAVEGSTLSVVVHAAGHERTWDAC